MLTHLHIQAANLLYLDSAREMCNTPHLQSLSLCTVFYTRVQNCCIEWQITIRSLLLPLHTTSKSLLVSVLGSSNRVTLDNETPVSLIFCDIKSEEKH